MPRSPSARRRPRCLLALLLPALFLLSARVTAAPPAAGKPGDPAKQGGKKPEVTQEEKECLAALGQQQGQLARQPGDLSLRLAWCRNRIKLGEIRTRMYKFADARAVLADTASSLRVLADKHPKDPGPRLELARCLRQSGHCSHEAELLLEAADSLGQAARILEKLAADFPTRTDCREELVGVLAERGDVLMWLGRFPESEATYRRALQVARRLVKDCPRSPEQAKRLATVYNSYAFLVREQGRFSRAIELIREAIGTFRHIRAEHPDQPDLWCMLPILYRNLAQPLSYLRDSAGESTARREADRLDAQVARARSSEPEGHPFANGRLASEIITGGNIGRLSGGREEAETGLREAQQRLREHPDVPAYRCWAAGAEMCLAAQRLSENNREETLRHLRKSCDAFAKIATDFPAVPKFRLLHATTQNSVGLVCLAMGHPAESERQLRRAYDALGKLADDYPRVARFRYLLSTSLLQVARTRGARREQREAIQDLSRALAVMARLSRDFPACVQFRRHLADHHLTLAQWQAGVNDYVAAEAALRESLRLWAAIAAEVPSVPEFRIAWGNIQTNLGDFLSQHDRAREAAEAYAAAVRIYERLCADCPKDALAALGMAAPYSHRGRMWEAQKRPADALKDYSRALSTLETALRLAPHRRDWFADLKSVLELRASVLLTLGRQEEYERDTRRADEFQERMQDAQLRLIDLGLLVEGGELARARAGADDLATDESLSGPRWYELATLYAKLAAGEASVEKKESAAAAAVRALRKAREDGYKWATPLAKDPVFRPLASRPDFKDLDKRGAAK